MNRAALQIRSPGRKEPITYPPPFDVRYGELVRLRNEARKRGLSDIATTLTHEITHFMDASRALQRGLFQ